MSSIAEKLSIESKKNGGLSFIEALVLSMKFAAQTKKKGHEKKNDVISAIGSLNIIPKGVEEILSPLIDIIVELEKGNIKINKFPLCGCFA